jgi:hypothetical protein
MEKFDKWRKDNNKNKGEVYVGAAGGAYEFVFIPTGIGTVTKVRCADGEEIDLTDITNKILASPGAEDKLEKLSNNLTESDFNLKENDGVGGFATLAIFGIAGGLSTWMGVAGYAIIASNPIFATAAISAALIACVASTLVTFSSDGSKHPKPQTEKERQASLKRKETNPEEYDWRSGLNVLPDYENESN